MAICTVHLVMLTMKILTDFFIKEFGDPKFATQGLCKVSKMGANTYAKSAEYYRSVFANYFVSQQGELPWQHDYVRRTSYDMVS